MRSCGPPAADLMMSHINSYVREASDDKTSYELMTRRFGIEFADLFNIKRIPANEIILKPSLLGIEQKVDTLKFFLISVNVETFFDINRTLNLFNITLNFFFNKGRRI